MAIELSWIAGCEFRVRRYFVVPAPGYYRMYGSARHKTLGLWGLLLEILSLVPDRLPVNKVVTFAAVGAGRGWCNGG